MTYLAAWLVTVGCADLVRPGGTLARRRGLPAAIGAALLALVATWVVVGAPTGWGLGVWALLGLLAAGWVLTSARAIEAGLTTPLSLPPGGRVVGRRHRLACLGLLAAGTLLALGANGAAPDPTGPAARWYAALDLPSLAGTSPARALLVLGVLLVQVGTANVVVRVALDAAGARSEPGVLRGGRLLGPLERVFIVGLGLAGELTAASIVIAAKGVLRFPELSKQGTGGQRIDAVTEYFLVGSFVSWLVALVGVVLAHA